MINEDTTYDEKRMRERRFKPGGHNGTRNGNERRNDKGEDWRFIEKRGPEARRSGDDQRSGEDRRKLP